MTLRTNITRALAATAATGLLALGLTACGGSSDTESFCKAGEDAGKSITGSSSDADSMEKVVDLFKNTKAPDAIADDWKTLGDTYTKMYDASKNLDTTDPDYMTKAAEAYSDIDADKVQKASENVSNWVEKNCK